MKITLVAMTFCATAVFVTPTMAQFPETGGVSSQTGPTTKTAGAALPPGSAVNSNSPAQNGTSAHDNAHGNNSTSPSDGAAGTPVQNGSKTVAGTSTTNGSTTAGLPRPADSR
jgi:hypothetical protein